MRSSRHSQVTDHTPQARNTQPAEARMRSTLGPYQTASTALPTIDLLARIASPITTRAAQINPSVSGFASRFEPRHRSAVAAPPHKPISPTARASRFAVHRLLEEGYATASRLTGPVRWVIAVTGGTGPLGLVDLIAAHAPAWRVEVDRRPVDVIGHPPDRSR
jgi:hypothetical protein